MLEFDLPALESQTRVRDAFGPMVEAGTSGLVSWNVDTVRLVRFDYLESAFSAGLDTLSEVRQWDAASVMLGAETAELVSSLKRLGLDYGVLGRAGSVARVVSVHEPLAGIYLASPPGAKCENPGNPHYYPPHRRNHGNPHRCVVCGFPVP